MGADTGDLTHGSFNSNMSALSGQLEEGLHLVGSAEGTEGSLEERMAHAAHMKSLLMARPLVGQPIAPGAASGRPIVKGRLTCLTLFHY